MEPNPRPPHQLRAAPIGIVFEAFAAVAQMLTRRACRLLVSHITFNGDYVWPPALVKDCFRPLRNSRSSILDAA